MSAFAPVTLNDSAAAAVAFGPQSIDSTGLATYLDNNSVYDAKRKLTMLVSLPKNGSTVARIKQKVLIPIMDPVVTTKKIAEAYITIEAVVPKTADATARADLKAFAANLLANAVSTAAFTNLEAIY